MQVRMFPLILLLACLSTEAPVCAQGNRQEGQGHPLTGVWLGDWGMNKQDRTEVTIEMSWDGKAVTGSINPGPSAIPFTKAELNHNNWTVHLEAEQKGVKYIIDGSIENLGSINRSIVGTWQQGHQKGDFRIKRH